VTKRGQVPISNIIGVYSEVRQRFCSINIFHVFLVMRYRLTADSDRGFPKAWPVVTK
jgi:hypothetical protein